MNKNLEMPIGTCDFVSVDPRYVSKRGLIEEIFKLRRGQDQSNQLIHDLIKENELLHRFCDQNGITVG